jgi:hypothetical protein
MSYHVPEEDALWCLLHDATETYLGDVVRPLKIALPGYRKIEDKVMEAICERFGLQKDDEFNQAGWLKRLWWRLLGRKAWMPPAVKRADQRIVEDERRALKEPLPEGWVPLTKRGPPLGVKIESWDWQEAERRYLARFEELTAG